MPGPFRRVSGDIIPASAVEQIDVVIGGERNTSSATNNYAATKEECNYTRHAPGVTTEQVITAAPAFLYGWIGVVGTGTLTLRDSAAAAAATSPFPAFTLAVGGIVTLPAAIRFEQGITAQLGTGTDVVTLLWRPI